MKHIRSVITAALALAVVPALAADLGAIDLSSGSAAFSNTPVAGGFADHLNFTLASASIFNGSITSVLNGNQDVDFTSISLTGPSGVFLFNLLLGDPVELWAAPATGFSLAAGSYMLTMIGTNSAGVGSYAGNIAVTAVPEPETYALLLGGLLATGFILKRRR